MIEKNNSSTGRPEGAESEGRLFLDQAISISMAGLVPQAIVLALGAGVLGGHDALRLLLQLAGRGAPAVDLAVCIAVISALTAHVLGAILLARFVRKPRAADALVTDLFARATAAVSVGATFLVTACLLVESGGVVSSARHLVELCADNTAVTCTALLIIVGRAAAGSLPCTTPLLRFFSLALGMRRFGKVATVALVVFSLACLLLAIPCAPPGAELSCSA